MLMARRSASVFLTLVVIGGCARLGWSAEPDPVARFEFTDIAASAGLVAPTWCGRKDKPHLLESGGTGVALVDVDEDGLLDAYLVNGWRLRGSEVVERGRDRLYHNCGGHRFEDVTEQAGLGHPGWGTGIAVGDVDGDQHLDLFVTTFGPDVLYRNQGDGTFAEVTGSPGIDGWSAGAVLFDADGDGDNDLFVAGYIAATLEEVLHAEPTLDWKGAKVMPGPFGLEGLANRFFVNTGDGTFIEATDAAGLTDVGLYYSFAVAAVDIDNDLDLDLYVANDSNPNYLYLNDGGGRFEEVGLWSGAALDDNAQAQAGMGIALGDIDNDLVVDLFVTNFAEDASTMYKNHGDALFRDISKTTGVLTPTYTSLSWGTSLADFDLDGDLDLFIANGHIYPQADTAPKSTTSYAQPNLLFENREGRFTDVSASAGAGLAVVESSRGLAVGDIDNDGDLDLLISNIDAPPTLLCNCSPRQGGWLLVDAAQARRVVIEANGQRQMRQRVYGASFVSASDPRFHFGVGAATVLDLVTVLWPDGRETSLEKVPVNTLLTLHQEPAP